MLIMLFIAFPGNMTVTRSGLLSLFIENSSCFLSHIRWQHFWVVFVIGDRLLKGGWGKGCFDTLQVVRGQEEVTPSHKMRFVAGMPCFWERFGGEKESFVNWEVKQSHKPRERGWTEREVLRLREKVRNRIKRPSFICFVSHISLFPSFNCTVKGIRQTVRS